MDEKDLKTVVIDLQQIFEGTIIFEIPPHYERWEDGFKSLDKARESITKVKARLEHTRGAPSILVADVARIHGMLSDFVDLRDHFYTEHSGGGDSQAWTQRTIAERQLAKLQQKVKDLKLRLSTVELNSVSGDASLPEGLPQLLTSLLNGYFTEEDLEHLAFQFDEDWGNFAGKTKLAKARAIVIFFQHRDKLDELKSLILRERPKLRDKLSQ